MRAGKQISIASSAYSKAIGMAFSKGFILYMIFPLILNVLILVFGIDFVGHYAGRAQEWFSELLNFKAGDFWGAETIGLILSWLVGGLVYVLFLLIFAYTGGYIIVIILTPVFAVLSEKTEQILDGHKSDNPFSLFQFLKDIVRGIRLSVRNFLIETMLAAVFFIVGFIPVIGWLVPIIMFFISAYFFGFSYFDFTNERHNRNYKQSITFVRKYKWAAVTNGALFSVVLFIPVIGVSLSAFIAVISVIAGTITVKELEKAETQNTENVTKL
jgi:CysZ protein